MLDHETQPPMPPKNYLIEGVSCAGKTTVGEALERLGYRVIHGDRVLAYQGDPQTGVPTEGFGHGHHIWDVGRVRALAAEEGHGATFFCGGSRNFHHFLDVFDAVFLLEVDWATLERRLDARPADEWGGEPTPKAMMKRLHASKEDQPAEGLVIDASAPVSEVVAAILAAAGLDGGGT